MKQWLLGVVGALSFLTVQHEPAPGEPVRPSPWQTDYAEARRVAVQTGRPLLVVVRCEH
jgi:hypothetical protein